MHFLCCSLLAIAPQTSATHEHNRPPSLIPYEPLSTLPSLLESARSPHDPDIIEQIRNSMALYPLIIDSKTFPSLSLIFAKDIQANYSTGLGVLIGLENVIATLQTNLKNVSTQHQLGTQVILVQPGGNLARSVTYYRAAHFKKDSTEVVVTVSSRFFEWRLAVANRHG